MLESLGRLVRPRLIRMTTSEKASSNDQQRFQSFRQLCTACLNNLTYEAVLLCLAHVVLVKMVLCGANGFFKYVL